LEDYFQVAVRAALNALKSAAEKAALSSRLFMERESFEPPRRVRVGSA
jgi:hypothetical protein